MKVNHHLKEIRQRYGVVQAKPDINHKMDVSLREGEVMNFSLSPVAPLQILGLYQAGLVQVSLSLRPGLGDRCDLNRGLVNPGWKFLKYQLISRRFPRFLFATLQVPAQI